MCGGGGAKEKQAAFLADGCDACQLPEPPTRARTAPQPGLDTALLGSAKQTDQVPLFLGQASHRLEPHGSAAAGQGWGPGGRGLCWPSLYPTAQLAPSPATHPPFSSVPFRNPNSCRFSAVWLLQASLSSASMKLPTSH